MIFFGCFDFETRKESFVPDDWDRQNHINKFFIAHDEGLTVFDQPPRKLPQSQRKMGTVIREQSQSVNLLWISPTVFVSSVRMELYEPDSENGPVFVPIHDYNISMMSPTGCIDLYVYDTTSFQPGLDETHVPSEISIQFFQQLLSPLSAKFFPTLAIEANEIRAELNRNFVQQLLSVIPRQTAPPSPTGCIDLVLDFKMNSDVLQGVVSHHFNPLIRLHFNEFDDTVTPEVLFDALRSSVYLRGLDVPALLLDPSTHGESSFVEDSRLTSLIIAVPPEGVPQPMLRDISRSNSLRTIHLMFNLEDEPQCSLSLLVDTTVYLLTHVRSCSSSLWQIKIVVKAEPGEFEEPLVRAIANSDLVGGVPGFDVATTGQPRRNPPMLLEEPEGQLWDRHILPSLTLNCYRYFEKGSAEVSPIEDVDEALKPFCGWIGMAVRTINHDFLCSKASEVASHDTSTSRASAIFTALSESWLKTKS
jgi:hypothetical protein